MAFFLKLKRNYLSKRRGLPHIFFLDTNSFKAHKKYHYLKASPIGKSEYLEMRRTYAQ